MLDWNAFVSGLKGLVAQLIAAIEWFYVTYPGTVTVLGTVFGGLALISPGISAALKSKRAKARHEPTPKHGRWAAAVLAVGRRIKGIIIRLRTDPEVAKRDLAEAERRISTLESRATRLAAIVAARKQVIPSLRNQVQDLERELAEAASEIARLNRNAIRARGMDAQANQASFARMASAPPPAVWKVARTEFAGRLKLLNVGGGTASNVVVTTNFPQEVTLSDAYAVKAEPRFFTFFGFEPVDMLDDFDLVFQIDWQDEAGIRRQDFKKAV